MSRRKTIDLASQQFYKFDKWILAESKLKKLSPTAKLLYMVITDREEISLKNSKDFTDSEGNLFQYFDQEKASLLIGVSLTAIKKAFKDLQEFNLIESVRQGQGKPNRLYVLNYKVSKDTLNELSYENKKAPTCEEVEAVESKNNLSNESICNSDKNNTTHTKKSEVENTGSAFDILRENRIRISTKDKKEVNKICTDIDKLKEAIVILKAKGSYGIDAIVNVYNNVVNGNIDNSKSNQSIYMCRSSIEDIDLDKMLSEQQERQFTSSIKNK